MRLASLFHLHVQGVYALAQEYLVVLVAVEALEVVVSKLFQRDFFGMRLDDVLEFARPLRLELCGVHQNVQIHHEQVSPQAGSLFEVVQNVSCHPHFLAKVRLAQQVLHDLLFGCVLILQQLVQKGIRYLHQHILLGIVLVLYELVPVLAEQIRQRLISLELLGLSQRLCRLRIGRRRLRCVLQRQEILDCLHRDLLELANRGHRCLGVCRRLISPSLRLEWYQCVSRT